MTDYINGYMLEMLEALQKTFKQFEVDFYIIGAVARDIHLSRNPAFQSRRKTKDVDIAIMISCENQFYNIKDALIATGNFKAHPTEAIKLFYKDSIELDLLPFGEIENEQRETRIHQPRLFIMDMPGFKEVLPTVEEIAISNNMRLKICSLEGLVLLKLMAYHDRPQRTKDVIDIDHIISFYFDLNDTIIYEEYIDLLDKYDTNNPDYLKLIGARVIGRKVKDLLYQSESLLKKAAEIVKKRPNEIWLALANGLED